MCITLTHIDTPTCAKELIFKAHINKESTAAASYTFHSRPYLHVSRLAIGVGIGIGRQRYHSLKVTLQLFRNEIFAYLVS